SGIASDGQRVAIVTTRPSWSGLRATLFLISVDESLPLDLGGVGYAPRPFGDRAGFIVGPRIVDRSGQLRWGPAPALAAVRWFARDGALTVDGVTWIAAGGPVVRAGGDGDAAWVSVATVGYDRLLVFENGAYRGRMISPDGWPVARLGDRLLFESVRGDDRLL